MPPFLWGQAHYAQYFLWVARFPTCWLIWTLYTSAHNPLLPLVLGSFPTAFCESSCTWISSRMLSSSLQAMHSITGFCSRYLGLHYHSFSLSIHACVHVLGSLIATGNFLFCGIPAGVKLNSHPSSARLGICCNKYGIVNISKTKKIIVSKCMNKCLGLGWGVYAIIQIVTGIYVNFAYFCKIILSV